MNSMLVLQLLVTVGVAASQRTPLEQADRIEPIGWSADRHTIALRMFFGAEHSDSGDCAGYVDTAGKPFRSGLAIVVLRDSAVLHSFVIQRPAIDGECTPLPQAKKALEAAKQTLDELGIDRDAPGTVLTITNTLGKVTNRKTDQMLITKWTETWRARDGDQTLLELKASLVDQDESGYHETKNTVAWTLKLKGAERTGAVKLMPINWSQAMVGRFSWGVRAIVSPEQESMVAFVIAFHSDMRGGWSYATLLPFDAKK